MGIIEGLKYYQKLEEFKIPIVSDFSDSTWAQQTGEVCDLVQILPTYVADINFKSSSFDKKTNTLKKGQFVSPWNMKNSVEN